MVPKVHYEIYLKNLTLQVSSFNKNSTSLFAKRLVQTHVRASDPRA